MKPSPSLSKLTEEQRSEALRRFHLVQPFLEAGIPLAAVARQHNIPVSTLRRWLSRYQDQGLIGLARQQRADRGQHRKVHPDLQRLIEGLALQLPRLTAAAIHRKIMPIAQQQGWIIPSYRTVADLGSEKTAIPRRHGRNTDLYVSLVRVSFLPLEDFTLAHGVRDAPASADGRQRHRIEAKRRASTDPRRVARYLCWWSRLDRFEHNVTERSLYYS